MNPHKSMAYHISSIQNPRIKEDLRLRNRRDRDQNGLVAVEGFYECQLALSSPAHLQRLYICPDFLKSDELSYLQDLLSGGIRPLYVTPGVMEKLSYRQHPDAWFAVISWSPAALSTLLPRDPERGETWLLAEDLEKPGNLGAVLRSADAAGADGVVVSQGRTDLRNPNVVRASKGVLFSLPCAEAGNEESYAWLRERGIALLVADPAGDRSLWEADLPRRSALVLGTEHEGLSSFWKERADIRLSIPMAGRVNSLNVAQAATIILYEIMRRRANAASG